MFFNKEKFSFFLFMLLRKEKKTIKWYENSKEKSFDDSPLHSFDFSLAKISKYFY